jgi:uncharacterized protein YbjQ (UPF0145 family)
MKTRKLILISTTPDIAGYKISETLDVVTGNIVQSKHAGSDFMAGLKSMAGGEIFEYTDMFSQARKMAHNRMVALAKSKGADAIVNIRYTSSTITNGMSEILAYGTAVKLEKC